MTPIPTAEKATTIVSGNLPAINEVCRKAGFPDLTAEEAVRHYYRPGGSPGYSFYPAKADAGANDAAAFSGTLQAQWEMAHWVTFGCGPEAAYAAQDRAAAEFGGILPSIHAAAAAINSRVLAD